MYALLWENLTEKMFKQNLNTKKESVGKDQKETYCKQRVKPELSPLDGTELVFFKEQKGRCSWMIGTESDEEF